MVGDIISEQWAKSSRNGWAASSRNDGRLPPESVLEHVGTEMALHVLAYNMKRVMRILGVGGLMEAIRA